MPGKKILLVEGKDDEHVIKHLCGNCGVPKLDEIAEQGSIEKLLKSFPVRLKESDVEVLGVLVDADTNLSARWESLRNHLIQTEYQNVPQSPAPAGVILPPPLNTLLPRVGIWIMPDNQTPGILEDFLRFLVPSESPLFAHVESSVAAIPQSECRFSELARPKAIIHTWLAWQEEPGKPLGTSITAKFLDPNVIQVNVLVNWLKNLFFPNP